MFKKICGGMRLVSILALVITAIVIFSASYFIFSKRIASHIRSDAYTVCEHLEAVSSDKPSFSEMLKDKAVFVLSSDGESACICRTYRTCSVMTRSLRT